VSRAKGAQVAGTVQTQAYRDMIAALVAARQGAGLSQAALAVRLGKPASFVGKYELGERRLDVVELLVVLGHLELSFGAFWSAAKITLPETL